MINHNQMDLLRFRSLPLNLSKWKVELENRNFPHVVSPCNLFTMN